MNDGTKKSGMSGYIPCDKPAEPGEDSLGFMPMAERVAGYLLSAESPFMMALYSPWGAGKTTMLGYIKEELEEKEKLLVVRFDAWDHENPSGLLPVLFLALGDAITDEGENKNAIANKVENKDAIKKSAWKIAKGVAYSMAGIGLKMATGGMAGMEDITAGLNHAEQSGEETKYEDPLFYVHSQLEKDFGELLKKLQEGGYSRVVFLIDDLDRCHPENIYNFIDNIRRLMTLLEKVGSEDGVGFAGIMALDKGIIDLAIKAKYPDIKSDPHEYFFKIFSYSVHLPFYDEGKVEELLKRGNDKYKINCTGIKNTVEVLALGDEQIKFLAELKQKSDGLLTPRHLLTFLRHYYLWCGIPGNTDKYSIKPQEPYMGPAIKLLITSSLLGLVSPKHLALIHTWEKKTGSLPGVVTYFNSHKETEVTEAITSYKKVLHRDIKDDWQGFQHKYLIESINSHINEIRTNVSSEQICANTIAAAAEIAGII